VTRVGNGPNRHWASSALRTNRPPRRAAAVFSRATWPWEVRL